MSFCAGDNSHAHAETILKQHEDFQVASKRSVTKAEGSVTAAMKNVYFMAEHHQANAIFADLNAHCMDQV